MLPSSLFATAISSLLFNLFLTYCIIYLGAISSKLIGLLSIPFSLFINYYFFQYDAYDEWHIGGVSSIFVGFAWWSLKAT